MVVLIVRQDEVAIGELADNIVDGVQILNRERLDFRIAVTNPGGAGFPEYGCADRRRNRSVAISGL